MKTHKEQKNRNESFVDTANKEAAREHPSPKREYIDTELIRKDTAEGIAHFEESSRTLVKNVRKLCGDIDENERGERVGYFSLTNGREEYIGNFTYYASPGVGTVQRLVLNDINGIDIEIDSGYDNDSGPWQGLTVKEAGSSEKSGSFIFRSGSSFGHDYIESSSDDYQNEVQNSLKVLAAVGPVISDLVARGAVSKTTTPKRA